MSSSLPQEISLVPIYGAGSCEFPPRYRRSSSDCRLPQVELPLPPFSLEPMYQTHAVTPTYRGIDGTFTHWRESLAPRPPAHPTLSSSTTRAPGSLANFVRGKGSYAPFLPGGLEAAAKGETPEEEEEEPEEEEGWRTRAPGLKRGMQLDGAEEFLSRMLGESSVAPKARRKRRDGELSPTLEVSRLEEEGETTGEERRSNGHDVPGRKSVDDLLPVGVSQSPFAPAQLTSSAYQLLRLQEGSSKLGQRRSGRTLWMSTNTL